MSYGTPEVSTSYTIDTSHSDDTCIQYLSPERAKGQKHDTRKSDIWALGVTFFEVLVGRTPFEWQEGEQLSSVEQLKAYWERTVGLFLRNPIDLTYHIVRYSAQASGWAAGIPA